MFKRIVYLLVSFTVLNAQSKCPDIKDLKQYNGHYYGITINTMSFDEAKKFAQSKGGYLAIPNSADENNFLKSIVGGRKGAYIGVYDPNYSSNYSYFKGQNKNPQRFVDIKGNKLSYSNWQSTQPDNLVEENDVYDGKQRVSPLGEHWAVVDGNSGKWWDDGNHFSRGKAKHYALIEFDKVPKCFDDLSSNVTGEFTNKKCSTKIWDNKTGNLETGAIFDCQTDSNGNTYCPSALSQCGQEWDYDDGYSLEKVGQVIDYTKKLESNTNKGTTTISKYEYFEDDDWNINRTYETNWYCSGIYRKDGKEEKVSYHSKKCIDNIILIDPRVFCTQNGGEITKYSQKAAGTGIWEIVECKKTMCTKIEYGIKIVQATSCLRASDDPSCNYDYISIKVKNGHPSYLKEYTHIDNPYSWYRRHNKNKPCNTNFCKNVEVLKNINGWKQIGTINEGFGDNIHTIGIFTKTTTYPCEDTNIAKCPQGYEETTGAETSKGECKKTLEYTYYNYLCNNSKNEQGFNYTPQNSGGDYNKTNTDLLEPCNSPIPPKNNCKREKFTCQANKDRPCSYVDNKWQCSPFPCFGGNDVIPEGDVVGANDRNNDGWNEDGMCNGQIYIFNAKDRRCRSWDTFFGLTGGGCCDKNKVVLGLIDCKEGEKILAKQNKAELCTNLGEYCSKKINLGFTKVCVQKSQGYCCFGSKLARVIHEQGRGQLGIEWGSAKSPNCRGFTIDEFQKLDFSKIDLNGTFDMPEVNQKDLTNKINSTVENFKNMLSTGNNKE